MIVDTATYEGLVYYRVLAEHREIRAALDQPARLARLVRIHDRCEELVLLPTLAGRELRSVVARMRAEHVELAQGFDPETLLRHLDEEEQLLLPGARAVLSDHHAAELLTIWDREREVLLRA